MRRLVGFEVSTTVLSALSTRASKVADGTPVVEEWDRFASTVAYENLRKELAVAHGSRERCAYCSDSRGVEVEHFWPKKKYPARAFDPLNFLLVCGQCNGRKSETFRLDGDERPLMLNPASDDPWDHLFFTGSSGLIAARLLPAHLPEVVYDARGSETLRVLGPILNAEPLLKGRASAWRNLVDSLCSFLESSEPCPSRASEFFGLDDHGLLEWLLRREGKLEERVRGAIADHEARWREVRDIPLG